MVVKGEVARQARQEQLAILLEATEGMVAMQPRLEMVPWVEQEETEGTAVKVVLAEMV
jgi:hypothetical protein